MTRHVSSAFSAGRLPPEPLLRRVSLGQQARLALRLGERHRVFNGIVARIRRDGSRRR